MISMLLLLAVSSLIIPSVLMWMIQEKSIMIENGMPDILAESRGISVIIIFTYVLWLFFTLSTHSSMLSVPATKAKTRSIGEVGEEMIRKLAVIGAITAATSGGIINQEHLH
jgi:Ca2+:H+ antiporter